MVKQKYPEQNIPCPCTYCLNQVVKTWQEVKNDLLINKMSPTYTTWIHHGEGGGGTNIIEPLDVHGSHYNGWIVEEEQEDGDDNILPYFDDLVQNLLTSKERAGRVPKFERVLDELKQPVSSGSTFSRFSFLSGCSISSPTIELAIAILMHYWRCCQMHSLVATYQNHMRRHTNIFEN